MAQIRDDSGKFVKKELATQEQVRAAYDETIAQLKELNIQKERGLKIDEEQKRYLVTQVQKLKEEIKLRTEAENLVKNQIQSAEDVLKVSSKMRQNYEGMKKTHSDIADGFAAMNKMAGALGAKLEQVSYKTTEGADAAKEAALELAKYETGVTRALKEFNRNNISAEQLAETIKDLGHNWEDFLDDLDDTNPEIKKIKEQIEGAVASAEKLPKAFAEAKKHLAEMKEGSLEALSEMPLGSQLGKVIGSGGKAGLFGLGAAAGVMAMDYFGAEQMAGIKAHGEQRRNEIEGAEKIAQIENERIFNRANSFSKYNKVELERQRGSLEAEMNIAKLEHERNYAGQRAAIQFSAQVASAGAEFKAASKTALFGKGLGSISYGASSMQMAGVGAEQVADQLSAASSAMGTNITSELAADMSIFAKRTGQSAESVAGMTDLFMRLDGSSAETAMNMQEGLYALAESANVDLGGMMKDIADASKEALGYQIKSGPALARQVAYSKSMGVNFNDIAKAGKGMVLNYKDSIKSEMQLSALLGRQVDLSEVRQKFATGDTEGALEALKSQGLDPSKMNMFQQQALTDATGMDLDTLNKIATRQGQTGDLGKGNVKGGNKQFLKTSMAAQSSLAATNASISANTAVLDAELTKKIEEEYLAPNSESLKKYQDLLDKKAELEKKEAQLQTDIENKWLASPEYINALAEKSKLAIEEGFIEAMPKILAAIAGGALLSNLAGPIIKKVAAPLLKGGFNLVKKGGQKVVQAFGKKTATTVATESAEALGKNTIKKYSQKQILAGFAGKEARDLALQQAGKTTASTVAKTGVSTAAGLTDDVAKVGLGLTDDVAKLGFKGVMGNLGKGLMKGGITGVLGTAASMAGDYFGGQRKMEGIQEGDASKVMQGRALQAGATAVEYAGYGAAIGSIVPGIGTAVGGAIGGIVGGIKGIWDGWFSDSAEAEDEALKQAEEQKKIAEQQKKLDEAAAASAAELEKQFGELGLAAQDETFFRSALLAQLVEATRLLDIMAFSTKDEGGVVMLDGVAVQRQLFNKAAALYSVVTPKPA